MVRNITKLLAATLVIDSLVVAWIIMAGDSQPLMLWWLLLANAVAIPLAAGVALLYRQRRLQVLQKHPGRASFAEHQKLHGSTYETMNGETVKSGGERMIADYFYRNKIRYEYEKEAVAASGRLISRPDFYLPDYDVYVEYWGMADTQDGNDRKRYTKGMEWKVARYRENGIKFISIYPREIDRLESVFKKKLKQIKP